MNKLLVMLVATLGLITTACNENEFSNQGLLSKVESLDSSSIDNINTESELEEEAVDEEVIEAVVIEMEREDVVEVKEPIIETIAVPELADTYNCKNKSKIMICHVPRGNTHSEKTLCLPKNAIKAHIKDMHINGAIGYMGPCKSGIN